MNKYFNDLRMTWLKHLDVKLSDVMTAPPETVFDEFRLFPLLQATEP